MIQAHQHGNRGHRAYGGGGKRTGDRAAPPGGSVRASALELPPVIGPYIVRGQRGQGPRNLVFRV
jgi:hypothetical protein